MVSYRAFSSHGRVKTRWHYCRYTTTLCMEWSIPTLLGSWCPQGFAAALLGGRAAEDSRRAAEDSRRATDELCERRCARRLF